MTVTAVKCELCNKGLIVKAPEQIQEFGSHCSWCGAEYEINRNYRHTTSVKPPPTGTKRKRHRTKYAQQLEEELKRRKDEQSRLSENGPKDEGPVGESPPIR